VPGGVTSTAQAKNVSSNSIFQYENFQMKARLVTRKANNGKATNSKDKALSTNGEGENPKMKPKSNSIAHMYELSAQGMPAEKGTLMYIEEQIRGLKKLRGKKVLD